MPLANNLCNSLGAGYSLHRFATWYVSLPRPLRDQTTELRGRLRSSYRLIALYASSHCVLQKLCLQGLTLTHLLP